MCVCVCVKRRTGGGEGEKEGEGKGSRDKKGEKASSSGIDSGESACEISSIAKRIRSSE